MDKKMKDHPDPKSPSPPKKTLNVSTDDVENTDGTN